MEGAVFIFIHRITHVFARFSDLSVSEQHASMSQRGDVRKREKPLFEKHLKMSGVVDVPKIASRNRQTEGYEQAGCLND